MQGNHSARCPPPSILRGEIKMPTQWALGGPEMDFRHFTIAIQRIMDKKGYSVGDLLPEDKPARTSLEEEFFTRTTERSRSPSEQLMRWFAADILQVVNHHSGFIAGGAVNSVFSDRSIADYDIYFGQEGVAQKADGDLPPGIIRTRTANAHTFEYRGMRYQFIRRDWGTPQEVINQFDLSICMGAFQPQEEKFILDPRFKECMRDRVLVYNKESGSPLNTVCRIKKYLGRGYTISQAQLESVVDSIRSLNTSSLGKAVKDLERAGGSS